MSKGVQIAIATLSVFGGLFWLVSMQADGSGTFAYYSSVAAYLEAEADEDRAARVHGFVVAGSIASDLRAGYVDFAIASDGPDALPVRYLGIDVPDLFRDGAEVVVEGHAGADRFLASRVMAKCPSKYESASGPEA